MEPDESPPACFSCPPWLRCLAPRRRTPRPIAGPASCYIQPPPRFALTHRPRRGIGADRETFGFGCQPLPPRATRPANSRRRCAWSRTWCSTGQSTPGSRKASSGACSARSKPQDANEAAKISHRDPDVPPHSDRDSPRCELAAWLFLLIMTALTATAFQVACLWPILVTHAYLREVRRPGRGTCKGAWKLWTTAVVGSLALHCGLGYLAGRVLHHGAE
jgi:hypothetical protein